MKNKSIFIIFGCMIVALVLTYLIDGPPKKTIANSYNPTNFISTKKMFDQHYKAYNKLVQFFMERKIEAHIKYDDKGNLKELNFIRSSKDKEVSKEYYESVNEFLDYMKINKLLLCAADINFSYGSPSDYWREYYSKLYKTNQLRFKAQFILDYLEGGNVSITYESIDDRIYNEGDERKLRPHWSYHIHFISCKGVVN